MYYIYSSRQLTVTNHGCVCWLQVWLVVVAGLAWAPPGTAVGLCHPEQQQRPLLPGPATQAAACQQAHEAPFWDLSPPQQLPQQQPQAVQWLYTRRVP
jgi:hypothetical protein